MQRRHFFTIAGSLALAGCGGGGPSNPDVSRPPSTDPAPGQGLSPSAARHTAIVIGAGMAGLAAARRLADAGKKVIVLEARDRLGGRLFTSKRWADAPVDVGATWIHGDGPGNPISDLARRAGARLATTQFTRDQIYDADGQQLDASAAEALEALREEIEQAIAAHQQSDVDASLREAVHLGVDHVNRSPEEQQQIDHLINTTFEHEYSGSADELSALWFDSDSRFAGSESLFLDGYGVLVDHVASGLDIRLQHVVSHIGRSAGGVTVRTNRGDFSAELAVVTLPLGVLQAHQVTFTPPLPPSKVAAISGLGVGVLNKCFLRFPSVFWDAQSDWLSHIPAQDQRGQWAEWVSLARPTGQAVLLGFNAADFGRAIEAWSDQEIVDDAMRTLRTIFGSGIPDPIDWQVSRWASDPFARGAYSFNKVGGDPSMRNDLARSVDRVLYFAGEATEPRYFQSVHGAYLSGQRAAAEALAR